MVKTGLYKYLRTVAGKATLIRRRAKQMKRKSIKLSRKTIALMAVALSLFAASVAMGAVTIPSVQSKQIETNFGMADTAVAIIENDTELETNEGGVATLSLKNFDKDSDGNIIVKPGKSYSEKLIAANKSDHDQYVRMIIKKYWSGESGKDSKLTPDMIEIRTGSDWQKCEKESTEEMEILYYKNKLNARGLSGSAIESIRINEGVLDVVAIETDTEQREGKTIHTYKYAFDGCSMVIEAELQAVQTHNAEEAIVSVWGNDAPLPDSNGQLQAE